MGDEPLYCTHCGEEMGTPCAATCPMRDKTDGDDLLGVFCHVCGVDTGRAGRGVCDDCFDELRSGL